MIFLNYDFWGDESSADALAVKTQDTNRISIQNAVFDELYVTNSTEYDMTTIPKGWDFNTILHALFDNSLSASNINYTLKEIKMLRLKRREIGSYNWVTLAEIPINKVDDFNVSFVDKYCEAGQNTEYSLVAVLDGDIEGAANTAVVESQFDGIVIAEKDTSYRAFLYDPATTERNQLTSVVTTLNSKYPYIIRNANVNYTSGQIRAAFLPVDSCFLTHDYINDAIHVEALTDFLTNGNPKVLKLDDGRSWLVNIVDNVSHSDNSGILYTDFSFVESGDVYNSLDLYDANLININAK